MERIKRPFRWWRGCVRTLNRKKRYLGLVVHFLTTILLTGCLLLVSDMFFVSSTVVEGNSMEDTLQDSDRLLIFKSDSLWHRTLASDYIPARGAIVITRSPLSSNDLLIKRVIGLPNERIVIQNRTITIYNEEFPAGFQPEFDIPIQDKLNPTEFHNTKISFGHVFVLGDNPRLSTDSRNFGPLPSGDILGELIIRFWPLDSFKFF